MTTIYKGRVVDLHLEKARLPNGRTVELEIIHHPGASAIVPVHENGNVVLVRQHRHATGGMIYEIPAGRLDPGEGPLECAQRELIEEVGQKAESWKSLGAIWTTPGFTNELIHLFLARRLTSVPQALEPDEVIEVVERPIEEAINMIHQGEIMDSKTICGLTMAYFQMNKERM